LHLLSYPDALRCVLPVLFSTSHLWPPKNGRLLQRKNPIEVPAREHPIVEMELWNIPGRWPSQRPEQ
jgi:hypothetical protein